MRAAAIGKEKARRPLVVVMFGFDFEFRFAGFANPVMFAIDESVVVDTLSIVFRTQIALHEPDCISRLQLPRRSLTIRS